MKRIVFFIITILLLAYIIHSGQEIYSLWKKKDLLTKENQKLQIKENEHKKLLLELLAANSPGFIEEQARNKLFFIKPGEYRVFLQPKDNAVVKEVKNIIPVWQLWMQSFFY